MPLGLLSTHGCPERACPLPGTSVFGTGRWCSVAWVLSKGRLQVADLGCSALCSRPQLTTQGRSRAGEKHSKAAYCPRGEDLTASVLQVVGPSSCLTTCLPPFCSVALQHCRNASFGSSSEVELLEIMLVRSTRLWAFWTWARPLQQLPTPQHITAAHPFFHKS